MSIEKITSKIISDAESMAKVSLDESKALCDEILSEAEKKAQMILEEAETKGSNEKEKLIARRKSVADIDGRKMKLDTKQQMIKRCFDKAVEKLSSMEEETYIPFLAGLVKRTGEKEGELILNKRDKASIGEALIGYLSENLPDSKITLAQETRNICGGFFLKQGAVYINGTVEALVEEAREELIGEVAGLLFQ